MAHTPKLVRKSVCETMSNLSSKSTKELLHLVRKLVPPLSPKFHKGQAGRVVVFGGCEDYTGAPYFSAHAAAVFGCDLSHVVCEKAAAPIIKSYTPNLMVHPYLYQSDNVPEGYDQDQWVQDKVLPKIKALVGRIHVAVLGPGFGRDVLMLKSLELIMKILKDQGTPMILDADALYLVSQKPEVVKGTNAIITPNVVEFGRIAKAVGVEIDGKDEIQETIDVSKKLEGVTIMRKGGVDIIVHGNTVLKCDVKGSNRRVGGQGDTLTGTIATLVAWGEAYKSNIWEHDFAIASDDILVLSCFGGATVTRVAARKAFEQVGRAMQTTDVHAQVGEAYKSVIEDEGFKL